MATLGSPGDQVFRALGVPLDTYDAWLADFRRRLSQHDAGVQALARDLSLRTPWTVRAVGSPEFSEPPPAAGRPPDVQCEVGRDAPPICFEVELPETLVRRATVARLRALVEQEAVEARVVLVGEPDRHEHQIAQARRMLHRAGLRLEVVAIDPERQTITGADW